MTVGSMAGYNTRRSNNTIRRSRFNEITMFPVCSKNKPGPWGTSPQGNCNPSPCDEGVVKVPTVVGGRKSKTHRMR